MIKTNCNTPPIDFSIPCESLPGPELTLKDGFIFKDGKKHAKVIKWLGGIDSGSYLDNSYQIEYISNNKYINGQKGVIELY